MKLQKYIITILLSVLATGNLLAEDVYYNVKPGDSLMSISNKYYGTHQKWRKIEAANPGLNINTIVVGQRLRITDPRLSVKFSVPTDAFQSKVSEIVGDNFQSKKVIKVEKKGKNSYKSVKTVNNFYGLEKVNADKLKKYDKVEKAYLDLKEKNIALRKKLINSAKVKKENLRLKNKLMDTKANLADEFSKQLQAYTDLTEAQSKILQEKHRLLSQRLWLSKNGQVDKCVLEFAPHEINKKETYLNLISYLNAKFGKENIFVQPEENKLVIHLSGRAVYGFKDPRVRPGFKKIFFEANEYLEKLAVDHIYLTGHSRYNKVYSKDKSVRTGHAFVLDQAMAIQDLFINEYGWSPKKITASSFGASRILKEKKKSKRFEMVIQMKRPEKVDRQIAAVDADVNLSSLSEETMAYIGEPKYASFKVDKRGVEFHIARDYFWQQGQADLSEGGKQKMARIMKVMSKAEDVVFQFFWVPGRSETDEKQSRKQAFAQLDQLRSYLVKDLDTSPANIELGYKSRLNSLRYLASKKDDAFNKRLIIRVVPLSISNRPFKK